MSSLEKIASLASDLLRLESRIEATKQNLKTIEAMYRRIAEVELPEAMDAADVKEFRMNDGRRISVGMDVHAGIPKAREQEAFEWLRENGFDGIIKRDISIKFGKGDDAAASRTLALLSQEGLEPENKEAIHHSTLKAFVRELIEEGHEVPLDLFGAYIVRRAKVAQPS
jgi:hypothetical protein